MIPTHLPRATGRIRRMRRGLCGAVVVAAAGAFLHGDPRVALAVTPSVAYEPGRFAVRATVPRHADNRALAITAESADFYRSSTLPLNGTRAARIATIQFGNLPEGAYRISAFLLGVDDTVLANVHKDVMVTAPDSACTEARPNSREELDECRDRFRLE